MNEDKDVFDEVSEIRMIIDRLEDEIISINSKLKYFDIDRFNGIIEKIKEKQENLEVIREKEEKLQNVYVKLNTMINECKGCVSISRASLQDKKNFEEATNNLIGSTKNINTEFNKFKKYNQTMNKRLDKLDKIYDFLIESNNFETE